MSAPHTALAPGPTGAGLPSDEAVVARDTTMSVARSASDVDDVRCSTEMLPPARGGTRRTHDERLVRTTDPGPDALAGR